MSLTQEKLAYLAGFFDGDGYISIYPTGTNHHRIGVAITQKHIDILNLYKSIFGGSISKLKTHAYIWQLSSKKAASFLVSILPYLILKKDEATIAIEYQELIGKRVKKLYKRRIELYNDFILLKKINSHFYE